MEVDRDRRCEEKKDSVELRRKSNDCETGTVRSGNLDSRHDVATRLCAAAAAAAVETGLKLEKVNRVEQSSVDESFHALPGLCCAGPSL